MQKNWLALPLALLMLQTRPLFAAPTPFEGRWQVIVNPDDDARAAGQRPFVDTLTFKDGQFSSQAHQDSGFDPTAYVVLNSTPPRFLCEPANRRGEMTRWIGGLHRGRLWGTMMHSRRDGTVLNYSFAGERAF